MSMIEQAFEANYTSGNPYEKAVEFHNDEQFYPVLYAGVVSNYEDELFYITRGSADYEYDVYVFPWLKTFDYDLEAHAIRDGWGEYYGVDTLEEAADKLGL